MKRILSIILLCCVFVVNGLCNVASMLKKGEELFNAGQYAQAKGKFEAARYEVDYDAAKHDGIISSWVAKCNAKINEQNVQFTVNGGLTSTSVSFGPEGGTRNLTIMSKVGTPYLQGSTPSWISVNSISSSSLSISCDYNPNGESRSGSFTVCAGSKSVRVNVSQSAPQQEKLNIYATQFANTNSSNQIINDFGTILYSPDIRFITPRFSYSGLYSPKAKTVYVKIYKPNGSLLTGTSSPSGYTTSFSFTFRAGSVEHHMASAGWGSSSSSLFEVGTHRYEIWIDGSKVYSTNFYVKEKKASYISVTNEATNSTASDGETVNANFDPNGSSINFTVNTNGSKWTTWGVPSFVEVINKTSNSFTLKVGANKTGGIYEDYMMVKSGNKEVRINLNQEVATATQINGVWIEGNRSNGSQMGLIVHVNLEVYGMRGHTIRPTALFYTSSGDRLRDYDNAYCTSDGQVAAGANASVQYDAAKWDDFKIFMPYDQLHVGSGTNYLQLVVKVEDKSSGRYIATSEYKSFSLK